MGILTVFTYVLAFVPWAVHAGNSCDANGTKRVIPTTLLQAKQESLTSKKTKNGTGGGGRGGGKGIVAATLVDGSSGYKCGASSTWLGNQNEDYTWTYTDCAALILGSSSCDKVTESCDFDPNSCSDLSGSTRRRSHLTTPCTSLCSQSYFLVGSDGNCGCLLDDTGCSDSAQWSTQSGASIYSTALASTPFLVDGSSGYKCGASSTWLGNQNEDYTWTYTDCAALILGSSSCDKVTESCDFDPNSCSDLSPNSYNSPRRRYHLTTPCTSLCSQSYFLVGSDGNCGCILDDTGCSDSAQWSTQSGVSIYKIR